MNQIEDIIATLFEAGCQLYLMKDEKIGRKRKYLFVLLYLIIIWGLTQIFHLDQIGLKVVIVIGICILLGFFVLGLSFMKSVFYIGTYNLLVIVSELIVIQIGELFHIKLGSGRTAPLIIAIFGNILLAVFVFFFQKVMQNISRQHLNARLILPFLLSNISLLVVGIGIYINTQLLDNRANSHVFVGSSIAMLAALILNIVFTDKYITVKNNEKDQELSIYQLEVQGKYYEDKLQEEEKIKKIYHDLKNHLAVLSDLEQTDTGSSTNIENIKKDIVQYEDYFRTGNKILDVILKDKIGIAKEQGIQIFDNIDMAGIDFMEALDISTIFGNLLDNAIEACKLVEDGHEKIIQVRGKTENRMFVVRIDNSKAGSGQKSSHKQSSHKQSKKKIIHGYGLINVTNAVQKYDGTIDITESDTEFQVCIIIPLQETKNHRTDKAAGNW